MMGKHILSVCVFCLLCATHSPCESHGVVNRARAKHVALDAGYDHNAFRRRREADGEDGRTRSKMNVAVDSVNGDGGKAKEDGYLQRLFEIYGNGKVMTKEEFMRLFKDLQNGKENATESKRKCTNNNFIPSLAFTEVNQTAFNQVCPSLVYNALEDCQHHHQHHHHDDNESSATATTTISTYVWLYSTLSVVAISACGVLALAVIPIMQTHYYQQMLQFFVALAVSTLAGDALLHLLPHSMSVEHQHGVGGATEKGEEHGGHEDNMWKGFVAMTGLIFFFVMEKFIVVVAKWRKAHQMKQKPPKVKVMKTEALQPATTSEKQCKHKYSSIPYCYNAIAMIDNNMKVDECPGFRLLGGQDSIESHNETATTTLNDVGSDSDLDSFKKLQQQHAASGPLETNQNVVAFRDGNAHAPDTALARPDHAPALNDVRKDDSVEYTVILREHENRHHGHSHTHGHVHAAPKTMSSVAWMVIMGDGLHNFTDGMAIGAAFSNGIAGGFSTTVAVFCHELPHELGDFAMLLKAGMTVRQALFYNLLSSVLCLLGNVLGVYLGAGEAGTTWLFAMAAGMFIYIALVDMMPELSSGHDDDGTLLQHLLQLGGLLLGFAIMTLIALYEHDLKHIFLEPA